LEEGDFAKMHQAAEILRWILIIRMVKDAGLISEEFRQSLVGAFPFGPYSAPSGFAGVDA
jgi:hypothetical protein